jgi:Glycosyl transferase family 2
MSREILLGYASKKYDEIFPRLAVATFQKNNSRHLLEWFAWYTLMGVKRFYVYDHMSTDHSVKLWNRLANEFDIVTHSLYGPFSGNSFCNHYLSNYRSDADHDFIIQADGDEFYYPTDTPSLRHALASRIHKEWLFSGLGIYWTMFGSNNQIEWEKGLVTQTYNRRAKLDNPCKVWSNSR